MPNKMTDNEIVKALECCSSNVLYEKCVDCPYEEDLQKGHTCIIKATKHSLDLINRQKAEIERLNKQIVFEVEGAYDRGIKAGAIEFADRLKAEFPKEFDEGLCCTLCTGVDNLLKEMGCNSNV